MTREREWLIEFLDRSDGLNDEEREWLIEFLDRSDELNDEEREWLIEFLDRSDELNDEEREWLIEFLDRSDISYTTPGRKDHVYVGKINGEKQYQQKRYLLWKLRDLHEIADGTNITGMGNQDSF